MISRLGQFDFIRPIRSLEFTPSKYASEVDNYLDAIQMTDVGEHISIAPVDTFERRDKSVVTLTSRDEKYDKKVESDKNWMSVITGWWD